MVKHYQHGTTDTFSASPLHFLFLKLVLHVHGIIKDNAEMLELSFLIIQNIWITSYPHYQWLQNTNDA